MGLFDELDKHSPDEPEKVKMLHVPFSWAGGKTTCRDQILPFIPHYKGWCEVFGGSMSLTLAKAKSDIEVYNDRYGGVVDFYKCLRDRDMCKQLIDVLQQFVHSREDWYDAYESWDRQKDPIQRAAYWYYMIIYSFGKRGDAFGRSTYLKNVTSGVHLRKTQDFMVLQERIKNILMENLDFREVFAQFQHPETVMYCDPPYLETDHTSYFGNYFQEKDHIALLNLVFKSPSFVAVSGHENKLYKDYPWTKIVTWDQYRSIKKPELEDMSETRGRETEYRKEVLYIKERD